MAEAILIDTNILMRSTDTSSVDFLIARRALHVLRQRGSDLCLAPQNIIEFWAVATRRREDNGLGMSHPEVAVEVRKLRRLFQILWTTPEVFEVWLRLVTQSQVTGKQTHDAHLVAVMQAYAISSVLTFNGAHFRRFPGINVLDPRAL